MIVAFLIPVLLASSVFCAPQPPSITRENKSLLVPVAYVPTVPLATSHQSHVQVVHHRASDQEQQQPQKLVKKPNSTQLDKTVVTEDTSKSVLSTRQHELGPNHQVLGVPQVGFGYYNPALYYPTYQPYYQQHPFGLYGNPLLQTYYYYPGASYIPGASYVPVIAADQAPGPIGVPVQQQQPQQHGDNGFGVGEPEEISDDTVEIESAL